MKALENIVDSLVLNDKCAENDKELVLYGLTMGIEMIIFISTITVLGIAFNLLFQGLIFFVSFTLIRTYAGGYHCNSGKKCYVSSCIIVLIFFIVLKYLSYTIMLEISILLLLLSIIIILRFAPVNSNTNLLDDTTKAYFERIMIRNLSIESLLIGFLIVFNQINYVFVISLAIFTSGILILVQQIIINYNMTIK